jgi:hypothetical protein
LERFKEVYQGINDPSIIEAISNIEIEKTFQFDINTTQAIANGIRRCAISEMIGYAMSYDYNDYKTNSNFVVSYIHAIKNKIEGIHLHLEDIDLSNLSDLTFKLSVVNNTDEYNKPIFSSSIIPADGRIYFNQNVIIGYLNPGDSIKIENINIRSGIGFDDACFQTVIGFSYRPLDYTAIDYVSDKKCLIRAIVKSDDIKQIEDHALVSDNKTLIDPSGLVMVDIINEYGNISKVYIDEKDLSGNDPANVLINTTGVKQNNGKVEMTDVKYYGYLEIDHSKYQTVLKDKIKEYKTNEITPMSFRMSFTFIDKVDHKKFMNDVIGTLIHKLKDILSGNYKLDITDDEHRFTIYDATSTIGNMICESVFALKPNISNVNNRQNHITDRTLIINIVDGDAEALMKRSIENLINILPNILF